MNAQCTVVKNGNSAGVTLPVEWRRKNNVDVGDALIIEDLGDGRIAFSKPIHKKGEIANDFLAYIESLPKHSWDSGDTPADDKALARERYV